MTDAELEAGTPTPDTVVTAASETAPLERGDLVLIGLFTGPKGAKALVRTASGKFQELRIGDKIGGQQVAAIDSGTLILSARGQTRRLRVAETPSSGRKSRL